MTLIFVIPALAPFLPGFAFWFALNFVLMLSLTRRMGLHKQLIQWLVFPATLFVLLDGQTDIIFLWLATYLYRDEGAHTKTVILAATLLTLKPQIAFVMLPWFLLRWLKHRPLLLFQWFLFTGLLHLLPLMYDTHIYFKWMEALRIEAQWRLPASPGVFALTSVGAPIAILAIGAVAIAVYGLFQDSITSQAAQLTALPAGLWYDQILLVGSIPPIILLPVSWIAFLAASRFKTSLPLATVPLVVLGWRILKRHYSSEPNKSLQWTAAGAAEGEVVRPQASLLSRFRASDPLLPLNSRVQRLSTSTRLRRDTTMADSSSPASTRTSRVIHASREALYRAFTDPEALAVWLSPGEMTGKVHEFDARVGRGYRMSLFYPASEQENRGKTTEREDRFTARFVELTPPSRIVQAITFDSADPAFSGEMTMVVTLEKRDSGTEVTILFENIPPGIHPEDNEAGTRSSLEKLAHYIE